MLYYLFDWLDKLNFPGAQLFHYISFRAAFAIILSLFISMIVGKSLIGLLRKRQIGESIRDLGLAGQMEKKGTPTMGGLIIIAAIITPTSDAVTLAIVSLPMYLLYELSILLVPSSKNNTPTIL